MEEKTALPDRVRVQDKAYETLKRQILTLELKPGERLSENTLSAQLDTGRPMIRDILAQLSEEGYVAVYPQRGTMVTMIDPERVRQAVYAHIVLEQAVIDEVCRKGLTHEERATLRQLLKEQEGRKEDLAELLIQERQISHALASFCKKTGLLEVFRTLDCDMLRVMSLHYSTYSFSEQILPSSGWEYTRVECRMLADNLEKGDADAAKLLCSNHFNMFLLHMDSLRGIYPQFFSG